MYFNNSSIINPFFNQNSIRKGRTKISGMFKKIFILLVGEGGGGGGAGVSGLNKIKSVGRTIK